MHRIAKEEQMEKKQEQPKVYNSLRDWRKDAKDLFGEDPSEWKFICPVCGHIATVKDWKDTTAPSGAIAFSCVGRWREDSRDAFGEEGEGPCNYTGGGLFNLNPVTIHSADDTLRVFDFAPVEG